MKKAILLLQMPIALMSCSASEQDSQGEQRPPIPAASEYPKREHSPSYDTGECLNWLKEYREKSGQIYPNGFLGKELLFRNKYLSDDISESKLSVEYSRIAIPKIVEFYKREDDISCGKNSGLLKNSFEESLSLMEEISIFSRNDEIYLDHPLRRDVSGVPNKYVSHIEVLRAVVRSDTFTIAYMMLVLDEDYEAFEKRISRILLANEKHSLFFRDKVSSAPGVVGKQDVPLVSSKPLAIYRSLTLYHLLRGEYAQAEAIFIRLIDIDAANRQHASFAPYSHEELAKIAGTENMGMDKLIYGRGFDAAEVDRPSELIAFYIEWLDLSSRTASHIQDRQRLQKLRSDVARFEHAVPDALIADDYAHDPLRAIKRRIDQALKRKAS